jgi:ATP-dependent helicase/DNAse subunit B
MTSSLHTVAKLLFIVPTYMWFELLRAMLNKAETIKYFKALLVS